jgi:hypothetical protein
MSGVEFLQRINAAPIPADLPRVLDLSQAFAASARVRRRSICAIRPEPEQTTCHKSVMQ